MTERNHQELQAILRSRDESISRLSAALQNLLAAEQKKELEIEQKQTEIDQLAQICSERLNLIAELDTRCHELRTLPEGSGAVSPQALAALIQLLGRQVLPPLQTMQEQLPAFARRLGALESQLRELTPKLDTHLTQSAAFMAKFDTHLAVPHDHTSKLEMLQTACDARQQVIQEQQKALEAFRQSRLVVRLLARAKALLRPRLGVLQQHPPIPLRLPASYWAPARGEAWPKISIVTPSYMQGEFLEQTLLSVLDQQYPNLEYYVQDGGSTDNTTDVLRRHEARLLGWQSRPDKGQTQAINLGFARTNGEIMAWLNSDDLLLPGALAHVARYFAEHPEVDIVYGNRMLIDSQGRQIGRWVLPAHDDAVLTWADFVPQETLFWRRSLWDKVGGAVDESFRFAMDWDLILRMREAGARFRHLPRHLGAFRVHEQQKTSAAISEVGFAEMSRLRERCHGRPVQHPEIVAHIAPYMLRHLLADFIDRIRFRTTELRAY